MDWLEPFNEIARLLSGLMFIVVLMVGFFKARETVEVIFEKLSGWFILLALVVIVAILVIVSTAKDRAQMALVGDELAALVSSTQGQIIDDLDALRSDVSDIDSRLADFMQARDSESTTVVVETRRMRFSHGETNAHCVGARPVRWRFRPSEGWRLNPESIEIEPMVISSKSEYSGIEEASEYGFFVVGVVANSGRCVGTSGRTIRDVRGTLRVTGTFEEERLR
ncbi:MAG: hypothetical protein F4Z74_09420 [Acidobacteria bacterium]|nr:hypothetical protein [Acidobacteriota bacterium]MXW71652.1 hypothetical protein [Acidobacteriota bacterium]MYE45053.1 hypothetical protein [Acidobacteriota bacterium]